MYIYIYAFLNCLTVNYSAFKGNILSIRLFPGDQQSPVKCLRSLGKKNVSCDLKNLLI